MKEKETMYYVLIDVRTMDLTAPYVKVEFPKADSSSKVISDFTAKYVSAPRKGEKFPHIRESDEPVMINWIEENMDDISVTDREGNPIPMPNGAESIYAIEFLKNDRDLHRGRRDGLTKGIIGNVLDAIIATWEETNGKTHQKR